MSRNFHQAKNYQFTRDEKAQTITCYDGDEQLFHIYDESRDDNLINVYHAGLNAGRKQGAEEALCTARRALGIEQ